MIVDFLRGKMFASLDTGLNVVHVRDVARGHLLAAERGRVGEKYILGHANLSLTEIFQILAEITGLRPPRFRIPYAVAWLAAAGMRGRRAPAAGHAGGVAHGGPHGPQADVFQPGQGREGVGAPADRSAPGTGRRRAVVHAARLRRGHRTRPLPAHLVSRLTRRSRSNFYYAFLTLPRAAPRGPLRRLRFLPHRGRHRRPRRRARRRLPHGCGRSSRPGGDEVARCYTAGARPSHPIAQHLATAVRAFPIPREALEAIVDGVEMDLDGVRYERGRGPLSLLLPGRLRGRAGLHRDLRLLRPAGARLRRESRHRAAAHEYSSRRRRRRPGRPRLPPAGRSPRLRRERGRPPARPLQRCLRAAHGAAGRPRPSLLPPGARRLSRAPTRAPWWRPRSWAAIYFALLGEIEARRFQVFRGRITVPARRKMAIALRCWLAARLGAGRRAA